MSPPKKPAKKAPESPGPGRPSEYDDLPLVAKTLRLPQEVWDALDARRGKLSRPKWIQQQVTGGG